MVLNCSSSPLKAATGSDRVLLQQQLHVGEAFQVSLLLDATSPPKLELMLMKTKGKEAGHLFGTISSHEELCHSMPGLGNPQIASSSLLEKKAIESSCLSLLQERGGEESVANYSLPPGKVWLYIPKHQKLKSKRKIIADIKVTGSLLLRVLIGFCNYIPSSLCHK